MVDPVIEYPGKGLAELPDMLRLSSARGTSVVAVCLTPEEKIKLAREIDRGRAGTVRHVFVEPAENMTAFSRWIWFAALWLNVLNLIDAPVAAAVHLIRMWVASW
ncbi:hypothetical protein BMG03_00970 [Thioclava nitratireducens]|uniref:Uncharacterized protein n=1 Tax=Thioclava nitratireducens TaxID=1915078 RepID=A0ABN4X2G2_9RHOB|nr:hypothetical protein [Thioclava nitratireducens]AQS46527.1 hypothetical protein BMG03_00970 [Thioclava nitratireducens]